MAVEGGPFILFPGGPQVQRYATDPLYDFYSLLILRPSLITFFEAEQAVQIMVQTYLNNMHSYA